MVAWRGEEYSKHRTVAGGEHNEMGNRDTASFKGPNKKISELITVAQKVPKVSLWLSENEEEGTGRKQCLNKVRLDLL